MNTGKSKWVLRVYEKNGEIPIDEICLENVKADDLRILYNVGPHNPMYDCYPVTASQTPYLQDFLQSKIDLESYDYFVECEATD